MLSNASRLISPRQFPENHRSFPAETSNFPRPTNSLVHDECFFWWLARTRRPRFAIIGPLMPRTWPIAPAVLGYTEALISPKPVSESPIQESFPVATFTLKAQEGVPVIGSLHLGLRVFWEPLFHCIISDGAHQSQARRAVSKQA